MFEFIFGIIVGSFITGLTLITAFRRDGNDILSLPPRMPNESMEAYSYRLSKDITMREAGYK